MRLLANTFGRSTAWGLLSRHKLSAQRAREQRIRGHRRVADHDTFALYEFPVRAIVYPTGDTSGDEHEWDVHVLRITSPCCSADTEE
mmetsp:Transcript_71613/g.159257  ORF Transcript_71613/g.159257 Transcript_71613/m.159257 type:complete len:87 (-) Transcript_71613:383-643(-)